MSVKAAWALIRSGLHCRLHAPYQPAGVTWMLEREFSGCVRGGVLADEMGLGKTIMTIAITIGNPKQSTLVVVPNSVIGQWKRAFNQFAGMDVLVLTSSDVNGGKVSSETMAGARVLLTTYSVFNSYSNTERANPLVELRFGRIVLDEAQYIKNVNSRLHIEIMRLTGDVKWCLTGTPVTRHQNDFKSLMWFIGVCKEMAIFDMAEICKQYVLRRTKDDISKQVERLRLPPIEITLVESEFRHDKEREMYDDLVACGQQMLAAFQVNNQRRRNAMFEQVLRLRQCVTNPQLVLNGLHKKDHAEGPPPLWGHGSTKLDMLREQLLAQPADEKTLIFGHWTYELDAIQTLISDLGRRSVRLDGSMTLVQRDATIAMFGQDADLNVMVIQIECGGVGLNLQMATRVYINSLHWNATSELQAIGRAHRTGQTQKVFVKRLAITPSIDDNILELQGGKLKVASIVLSDPRIQTQLMENAHVEPMLNNLMRIFT